MNYRNYIILESLIRRYDYAGAVELIEKIEDVDIIGTKLLYSCEYAINFDFGLAYNALFNIEDENSKKIIASLKNDLKELIEGRPNTIFSELLENTKIQLDNRRYIDFLSRVYRLKEAVLKYIFARNHVDKNRFSFRTEVVSKRMIIKILRKKYKIFNPNLSFAISSYINKYLNKDKRYNEVLGVLNSNKMNEIIELRHESIAGHGFKGVNRKELVKIYGNPYSVIDDFYMVLEKIGVNIHKNKYDKINKYILERFEPIKN